MTQSKKIFVGFVVVFLVSIGYLVYDISRKTTFPGSRKRVKQTLEQDSLIAGDSVKRNLPPKTAVHQP